MWHGSEQCIFIPGGWEQRSFLYQRPLPSVPQNAADSIQINGQTKKGKSNVNVEMDEHTHRPAQQATHANTGYTVRRYTK